MLTLSKTKSVFIVYKCKALRNGFTYVIVLAAAGEKKKEQLVSKFDLVFLLNMFIPYREITFFFFF